MSFSTNDKLIRSKEAFNRVALSCKLKGKPIIIVSLCTFEVILGTGLSELKSSWLNFFWMDSVCNRWFRKLKMMYFYCTSVTSVLLELSVKHRVIKQN